MKKVEMDTATKPSSPPPVRTVKRISLAVSLAIIMVLSIASVDWLRSYADHFGTLPVMLVFLGLLSVALGPLFNPDLFWSRHNTVGAFLAGWLAAVASGIAMLYLGTGVVLMIHPGHYNRWWSLLLALPAVLVAAYVLHRRRLARLASQPPFTTTS